MRLVATTRIGRPRDVEKALRRKVPGAVLERDFRLTPRGRLRGRLIVFESAKALRAWWGPIFGKIPMAAGAVNACSTKHEKITADGSVEWAFTSAHPRYFCVIGLCLGYLDMEVVAHEAAHVGFCYARRVKKDPFLETFESPEEVVCYAAGRAARAINATLHEAGLYEGQVK